MKKLSTGIMEKEPNVTAKKAGKSALTYGMYQPKESMGVKKRGI